jgi:hypothetical protein
MVRASVVLLAVALGCGGSGLGPDAGRGPDAVGGDGPAGSGGLTIDLVAQPALDHVAPGVAIDELRLWLRDVRAIGDAAPGDGRTLLTAVVLDYRSDHDPDAIAFPLAPPGLYSEIDAHLGQGGDGFELRGTVTVAGRSVELEIRDQTASGTIMIPLGALRVDNGTHVTVTMDLAFLGAIDWATLAGSDDKIELEGDNPATQTVLAGILAAFQVGP